MGIQVSRTGNGKRQVKASIDYLARDYSRIKQELLERVPELVPEWTDRSEADLGIALVELFAHMGDILSYYQDRIAAEAFLPTATSRQSVINHLRLIGYELRPASPAWVEVALKYPVAESGTVAINPGNRFSTEDPKLFFEYLGQQPLELPLDSAQPVCTRVRDKTLFFSEAKSGQTHVLKDKGIIPEGEHPFELFVDGEPWTEVEDFSGSDAQSMHYVLSQLGDKSMLVFGSSSEVGGTVMELGAIPPYGARIAATYTLDTGFKQTRSFLLHQGQTHQEEVGLSDGEPGQSFVLSQPPKPDLPGVLPDTVQVRVDGVLWERVTNFVTTEYEDRCFTVELDADDRATITFGDGRHGRIPNVGASIVVTYRTGGGTQGNIGPGRVVKVEAAADDRVKSRNAQTIVQSGYGSGGADRESIEDAVRFGPMFFRSRDRAVTADDFRVLLQSEPRWRGSKVMALHQSLNRIRIYFAPSGGAEPSSEEMLQSDRDINEFLHPRRMVGVQVEVKSALYVPVRFAAHITVDNRHFRSDVTYAAQQAVAALLDFDQLDYGSKLYLSKFYEALEALDGVDSALIFVLARQRTEVTPSNPALSATSLKTLWQTIAAIDTSADQFTGGKTVEEHVRTRFTNSLNATGIASLPAKGYIEVREHEVFVLDNIPNPINIIATGGY